MKIILIAGIILSLIGLIGILTCAFKGIKIKRLDAIKSQSPEKLKDLLRSLYILNMLSLSISFFGLLIVVIGITLGI